MIIDLLPANDGKHKWVALFKDGKRVKFGAEGYEDYTMHKNRARRDLYRKRHEKDLRTGNPYRPGYLSYFILWGDHTNLRDAVRAYNREFFPAQ
jgi:hypothetical protein